MTLARPARPEDRPSLQDLSDDARLWIFGSNRTLVGPEARRLADATETFVRDWAAHGEGLTASFEWRYDRFLLIAVDERRAAASGCSIDALTHHVRELERAFRIELLDGSRVWYRGDGAIRCVGRTEFHERAKRGEVSRESIVFDLGVQSLAELRSGRWELPAGESWHAQLLPGGSA